MSQASVRRRLQPTRVDAALLLLTLLIQIGALVLYQQIEAFALTIPDMSEAKMDDPVNGVALGVWVVVESIAVVLLYRGWKRLSEQFRERVKRGLKYIRNGMAVFIFATAWYVGLIWPYYLTTAGALFVLLDKYLESHDYDWVIHNGAALVFGIGVTAVLGWLLNPAVALVWMVLMTVWDKYAVHFSEWMSDIIEISVTAGIANYFIIPSGWQIDYEELTDWIGGDRDPDDRPDDLKFIIGLGDFIEPALLCVSGAAAGGILPALGAFIGTVIATIRLRIDAQDRDEGLPALVWLNSGAILGFATAVVVSGIPVAVALGLQSPEPLPLTIVGWWV